MPARTESPLIALCLYAVLSIVFCVISDKVDLFFFFIEREEEREGGRESRGRGRGRES